jgi:hypothetical protein
MPTLSRSFAAASLGAPRPTASAATFGVISPCPVVKPTTTETAPRADHLDTY